MRRILFLLMAVCFLAVPAIAATPTASIQTRLDTVIAILQDPAYHNTDAAGAEEQYSKIFSEVKKAFDFKTISLLTTGKNWKRFSESQKTEFAALFAELLGNTYIQQVQENFRDEKVLYDSEDLLGKNKAEVHTHVLMNDKKIPILYKMRKRGDLWRVYDVKIEGISLVQNYRSQFSDFLFKHEPENLIDQIREKVKTLAIERKAHWEKRNMEEPANQKTPQIL